ncbi:hypothetical protein BDY19DRAFT_965164 [Irpex rosettiformis]|uniref:Uncharacterized protein n=1 Tax=Irpex rosettiformis TaxID=378272 RepID=A0ACB8TUY8_9APHY|nr:hypothetical protein BDY19DRAFT_965164 [Irpex rosettiformis]
MVSINPFPLLVQKMSASSAFQWHEFGGMSTGTWPSSDDMLFLQSSSSSEELWNDLHSPSQLPSPLSDPLLQNPMVSLEPLLTEIPRTNTSLPTQNEFLQCPSIQFWVDGKQGVRLLDALQGDVAPLQDGDEEVMHASSAKVSYRVEWLGYRPFTRQKYARRVRGLQNRAKIAKQVAEVVGEFVTAQSRYVPSPAEWRVGRGYLEFSHLYLLEIRRISRSTWVPVLAYAT